MAPWQEAFIAHAQTVLEQDDRVRAAYLSGSLARDAGDEWSDVDILIVARDDALGALIASAPALVGKIAETVYLKTIFGRVLNAITPDWRRFDLAFVTETELPSRPADGLKLLFSRTDARPAGKQAPEPNRLADNILEFIRVLGLSPLGAGRGEFAVMVDGAMILRRILIETMLDESGVKQADRGGALKLYPFLTPEQRAELEAIPAIAAAKDSVLTASATIARAFFPRAKRLAAARNIAWPAAMEDAMRAHLKRTLDLTL
jgi:predicted nucleotidyltransferase